MRKDHNNYSVYALICPLDGKTKYVGSTSDLERRYLGHLQTPLLSTKSWILDLRSKGLIPEMQELENNLGRLDSFKREKFWILKIHNEFGTLLNQKYVNNHAPRELPIKRIPKTDAA